MPPQEAIESSKNENEVTPEEIKLAKEVVKEFRLEVGKKQEDLINAMIKEGLISNEDAKYAKFFAELTVKDSGWYHDSREKMLGRVADDVAEILDEGGESEYQYGSGMARKSFEILGASDGMGFASQERKNEEKERRQAFSNRIEEIAAELGLSR